MDPNVARLIERTRARRAGLKEGSADGSPLPRCAFLHHIFLLSLRDSDLTDLSLYPLHSFHTLLPQ